jgi:hypothetical protein
MRVHSRLALLTSVSLALASTALAGAAPRIEDRVDLIQLDRSLIAVDASGQRVAEIDLERGEEVVAIGSQGQLGVASTSTRLLGFRSGAPEWLELRYRLKERDAPPDRLHLEDRIALVTLPARVVALTSSSEGWLELALSPGEHAELVFSEANLGAVVTPRRAIAVSDEAGFVEIGLSPRETVETTSTRDSSISLVTPRRLLVFRAGTGRWTEVPRPPGR